MIEFDDLSTFYDTSGYPTYYNNRNYTWTKGKLTRIHQGSSGQYGSLYEYCNFTYDGYGRRLSKSYSYDPNPGSTSDYSYMYTTTYDYDTSGRLIHDIKIFYYIPQAEDIILCQKSLLTEGAIEEFEKLFDGKIIKK